RDIARRRNCICSEPTVTLVTTVTCSSSRPNAHRSVGKFAKHLRRVHGLDARWRQVEAAGIVDADGVLDDPGPFGNEAVIGMEGVETTLLERGPDESALHFPCGQYLRVLGEPAAEDRRPARNRI